jgi:hypothetical protein
MSGRLARWLIRAAERLMPPARKEWARAMAAELAYCEGGAAALAFAAGCLGAAVREKAAAKIEALSPEAATGIAAGALFLLHAGIPDSRSWPWIWPVAGGALAILGRAKAPPATEDAWTGVRKGIRAGVPCAVLFFIGALLIVWARATMIHGAPSLQSRIGLIVYGSVGSVLLAAVAAGMTYAVVSRTRTTQCPL